MSAMPDKDPVLFLEAVERRYRQGESILEILSGAELAVWPGQSVALIGPSGAGKSTLLHIAGLLEHPDAGEVYVDGIPTSNLSDGERTKIRRTEIGFVYQFHHLLPEFSALENVMLPQMIRGLSRQEARCASMNRGQSTARGASSSVAVACSAASATPTSRISWKRSWVSIVGQASASEHPDRRVITM